MKSSILDLAGVLDLVLDLAVITELDLSQFEINLPLI